MQSNANDVIIASIAGIIRMNIIASIDNFARVVKATSFDRWL